MVTTIAPPNSIIFIFDRENAGLEIPEYSAESNVLTTSTCVSVGTLSEFDGDTSIEMTASSEIADDKSLMWTSPILLATPGKRVSIVTSENHEIASLPCAATHTLIRIGTNDQREPDRIVVRIVNEPHLLASA